ncbi:sigma-54 dependent transcriptional regulator [Dehalobacterium formicoaceticum]|uniref:sigma-54-dependent transcriptional regulator n=1 Tax=Dehalobacterium formicoaceticum TaxID=51515 RepID=UPI0031F6C3AE
MKINNRPFRVLVVDDEPDYREVLELMLKEAGCQIETAASAFEALDKLRKRSFDLVLTDLMMAGMDGIELLEKIRHEHGALKVIIITGYGTIENAVAAMKKGAYSYFIKGNDPDELIKEINNIKGGDMEVQEHSDKTAAPNDFPSFVLSTNNDQFRKVMDIAKRAAQSNVNILILGESGVGKEIFAQYIHQCSSRSAESFVPVHCQAFAEGLLESELFGHEKGAFTGAIERRKGRFEAAIGGTLFLDEVGDIPLSTQVKLLRAIENRRIERLGSNESIPVDFRLISATHKDLTQEIIDGNFREDFFYRLSTITIDIPPLRSRKEDLPILIDFFMKKSQKEHNIIVTNIEPAVRRFLLYYDYPGNIRELKNIIERLVVLSRDGVIYYGDLPEIKSDPRDEGQGNIIHLREMRRKVEANYIEKVLGTCNHNISEAARVLGISRRQLFNKITDYGIK